MSGKAFAAFMLFGSVTGSGFLAVNIFHPKGNSAVVAVIVIDAIDQQH
ncbi:hypothetical protein [Stenomitos frigidus]